MFYSTKQNMRKTEPTYFIISLFTVWTNCICFDTTVVSLKNAKQYTYRREDQHKLKRVRMRENRNLIVPKKHLPCVFDFKSDSSEEGFSTQTLCHKCYETLSILRRRFVGAKDNSGRVRTDDSGSETFQLGQQQQRHLLHHPIWQRTSRFGNAVGLCPLHTLPAVLPGNALPTFFETFPGGRAIVIETNPEIETRLSLVRGAAFLKLFGKEHVSKADFTGFASLAEWQESSSTRSARRLLSLISVLFYPQLHFFAVQRPIHDFVFILPEAVEIPAQAFPANWASLFINEADYGAQAIRDAPQSWKEFLSDRSRAEHRHLNRHRLPPISLLPAIDWFLARYDELHYRLSDPTEFVSCGEIDFATSYEFWTTIERIVRKGITSIIANQVSVRKSSAMEVVDLLQPLTKELKRPCADRLFDEFFNPFRGKRLLKNAFNAVPEPLGSFLQKKTEEIYDELEETIRASVYVKTKITERGVEVYDFRSSSSKVESWPIFTANVLRALRNTHHGYLSKYDLSGRMQSHLSLVTGDTPDSIAILGTLFALALIADPETILGWRQMEASAK